jgi:hypothetical protein
MKTKMKMNTDETGRAPSAERSPTLVALVTSFVEDAIFTASAAWPRRSARCESAARAVWAQFVRSLCAVCAQSVRSLWHNP